MIELFQHDPTQIDRLLRVRYVAIPREIPNFFISLLSRSFFSPSMNGAYYIRSGVIRERESPLFLYNISTVNFLGNIIPDCVAYGNAAVHMRWTALSSTSSSPNMFLSVLNNSRPFPTARATVFLRDPSGGII